MGHAGRRKDTELNTRLMTTRLQHGQAALLGVALAALLGACSGGPAGTPGALASSGSTPSQAAASSAPAASTAADGGSGSGDACKIVSADVVSQAVGGSVTTAGGGTICYFQNTDKSKYLVISLFASEADMGLMLQIEAGSTHVPSLGTDAFWAPSGGILFVRNGDKGFELFDPDFIPASLDNPVPAKLITLANAVLANL
jgi:hypothetical protein